MAFLTCPSCGHETDLDRFQHDAAEFCPSCDYPLFFADGLRGHDEELAATPGGMSAAARRRLPGTVGRDDLPGEACPACAELNLPGADYCHRCGSPMRPVPEPAPTPVVAPAPEPVAPPPPPQVVEPFPWVAVVVIGVLIVALLVVAAVTVARI